MRLCMKEKEYCVKIKLIPHTSHMSDFVLILSFLYCWLSGGSTLVLGPVGEKTKNSTVKSGSKKVNFFYRKIELFPTFLTVMTV